MTICKVLDLDSDYVYVTIFEYHDYRKYFKALIKSRKNGGRGEYKRIAEFLEVHSTLVSQIFSGKRALNLDQAIELSEYFGLSALEKEYLIALVHLELVAKKRSRDFFTEQLTFIRRQSSEVSKRVKKDIELTEADKAIFYSNWTYSAIRLLTSIPEFQTLSSISKYLNLPPSKIRAEMDFLISRGLCVEEENKIRMGPSSTHLPATSQLIARLHTNWRLKAIEKAHLISENEVAFTSPVSVSEKDFLKIKKLLIEHIAEICKVIDDSPAEKIACLNIDWIYI